MAKLTRALKKMKGLQAQFDRKLSTPVATTMSVLPGEPGRLGARGNRGNSGPQGYPGETGPQGRPGFPGRPGLPGDEGDRGLKGPRGRRGDQGRQGVQGTEGPPGPRGIRGNPGAIGNVGPKGYAGDNGPAGQDGQKGGPGKPGNSPSGPPGAEGGTGPSGPPGDKGAKGERGAQGGAGSPGEPGLSGVPGVDGAPGRDAHQSKAGVCGRTQTTREQNVCCSVSSVDWHSYYTTGALMDIDTSKCGFEEQPMYFTELIGSSHIQRMMGASSIYSPTESGFRIYLNEEVLHTTPTGSRANSWRYHIKWCGVGKATGPTVANVCCGTGPASWGSSRYEGSQNIDAKTCEMKGDPVWITAAEGAINSGPDQFIGTNAGYSQDYRYSHMYIRKAFDNSNYYGWVGTASMFNKGQVNMLKPKFCLFGEPFPTGDMRINSELIEPDEYPCNGVRVIDDGKIVSNSAKICCGKSDTTWKQKGKFNIYKEIDTSECSFLEDDSNQVVYMKLHVA